MSYVSSVIVFGQYYGLWNGSIFTTKVRGWNLTKTNNGYKDEPHCCSKVSLTTSALLSKDWFDKDGMLYVAPQQKWINPAHKTPKM